MQLVCSLGSSTGSKRAREGQQPDRGLLKRTRHTCIKHHASPSSYKAPPRKNSQDEAEFVAWKVTHELKMRAAKQAQQGRVDSESVAAASAPAPPHGDEASDAEQQQVLATVANTSTWLLLTDAAPVIGPDLTAHPLNSAGVFPRSQSYVTQSTTHIQPFIEPRYNSPADTAGSQQRRCSIGAEQCRH